MEETKKYNFEEAIAKEEITKVEAEAVTRAKQKMKEEQLERDAREVQSRLRRAENTVRDAEREGRYASKRKNILKKYSEAIAAAKAEFESTGDWKKYDKTVEELENEKNKATREAKEIVYGDEAWRFSD